MLLCYNICCLQCNLITCRTCRLWSDFISTHHVRSWVFMCKHSITNIRSSKLQTYIFLFSFTSRGICYVITIWSTCFTLKRLWFMCEVIKSELIKSTHVASQKQAQNNHQTSAWTCEETWKMFTVRTIKSNKVFGLGSCPCWYFQWLGQFTTLVQTKTLEQLITEISVLQLSHRHQPEVDFGVFELSVSRTTRLISINPLNILSLHGWANFGYHWFHHIRMLII